MKHCYSKAFATLLLLGLSAGCSGDDEAETCAVAPVSSTASADGTVEYSVSTRGDGSVSTITYSDGTEDVTVTSPTLPFSVSVNVAEGDEIALHVKGTAKQGAIVASYAFVDTGGTDPEVTEAECSR
jgi:hypothetical protein